MKALFLIIGFIFTGPVTCLAGDNIGNGAGQAEQTIISTWKNLDKFINFCLNDTFCESNQTDKLALEKIKAIVLKEQLLPVSDLFIFTTAKLQNEPTFFYIDGILKMAKTGLFTGAPIYFDLDQLYTHRSPTIVESLSLTDAIDILIHEVGHHTGMVDHIFLGSLGAKVAGVAGKYIEEARLFSHSDEIKLTVINPSTNRGFPLVLLQVFGDTINLSQQIQDQLVCNGEISHLFSEQKPYGVQFFNLYWPVKEMRAGGNDNLKLEVKGHLALYCDPDENNWSTQKSHILNIKFHIKQKQTKSKKWWKLDSGDIKIKHKLEPFWFLFKYPDLVNPS